MLSGEPFSSPHLFLPCSDSFFNPDDKLYGVPVSLPGPGITYRNRRFLTLLDTPFAGANTIPAMFDISAKANAKRRFLGTRKLVAREMEVDKKTGREFEKLTMGEYSWESYERVHERACAFGAGLLAAGHNKGERLAIFAETRADWFVAMQGAFQHGIVVVTVYASLGEDALLFSLNQVRGREGGREDRWERKVGMMEGGENRATEGNRTGITDFRDLVW